MIEPYGISPAFRAALVAIVQSAETRRRSGYLSGLANALMIALSGLLTLVAALDPPLVARYPIEKTLRSATKRPMVLISADGQRFARRGDCLAEPITLNELPAHFVDAVLATEDRRFYSHIGIDPQGILRAAKRNYSAGAIREGGSTITQQLVKIAYLTSATTFERKMEEALLAIWLEMQLTKDQILERYLSSIYFGEGCFGVRAAARHFFGKPIGALNLSESALMVALIRSPTRLTNNLGDAHRRARRVVRTMIRYRLLDEARLAEMRPAEFDAARAHEFGSYYADWLAEGLQRGIADTGSPRPILVHTTFQPALQRTAEETVRSMLERQGRRQNANQAALVAMRTDGRVVAMVGGRERAASQFNRAVQARRQPGSAFKIFVYLAALRAGARLDMVFTDEPVSIDGWEPTNYGGDYRGNVTLTEAFTASINTVAVKVSEAVGYDAVIGTARDLGITTPIGSNASLSLGTSEVSLLEMTAAYAAIAAGAYPVKPWGVAGLEAKPAAGGEPPREAGVWKLAEAESMQELLSSVVQGGSGHAAQLPIPAFGKTGTSQEYRDAWFIGFAGNLVVGVWVGNDDDTPMDGVTGGSLPAEIWHLFMREAMKTDADFQRKLPRIAVFEARSQAPLGRALMSRALLERLAVPADRGPRRTRRSGQIMALEILEREEPRTSTTEQRRPFGRDFQRQLGNMGWPGQ
jgi:penicillin-binding protein 1A